MSLKVQKIVIIGCAGAGKTTLARVLGQRFFLPVYHLDYYYWKPGWVESEAELFKKTHQMLIEQSSWIIDGNQMNTIVERIAVADMVIFLDMPTLKCLWRIVWRWLKNRFYNKKDSQSIMTWGLICYAWRYNRVYRPIIRELISTFQRNTNRPVFIVKSNRKLKKIVDKIAVFIE